jgi:hypothetical protein
VGVIDCVLPLSLTSEHGYRCMWGGRFLAWLQVHLGGGEVVWWVQYSASKPAGWWVGAGVGGYDGVSVHCYPPL